MENLRRVSMLTAWAMVLSAGTAQADDLFDKCFNLIEVAQTPAENILECLDSASKEQRRDRRYLGELSIAFYRAGWVEGGDRWKERCLKMYSESERGTQAYREFIDRLSREKERAQTSRQAALDQAKADGQSACITALKNQGFQVVTVTGKVRIDGYCAQETCVDLDSIRGTLSRGSEGKTTRFHRNAELPERNRQ